jgi:hypothetical protein
MSLLGSKISLDAKRIWQPELRILEVVREGKPEEIWLWF